ncbi:MAG: AraC family transcriptional regulator [Rhizonema sp. PD38]|nr:AraC family transcriptional regulator [Rhizonema sp. PD38]
MTEEQTKFWRSPHLDNLDLLRVTYLTRPPSRHIHDTVAIGIVEQGYSLFENCNQTYIAPEKSVVLINPEDVHAHCSAKNIGCTYRMLYPKQRLLESLSFGNAGIGSFAAPIIQDHGIALKIYNLHVSLETNTSSLEVESRLLQILSELFQHYSARGTEARTVGLETKAVQLIKSYFYAHYADSIRLEQLAQLTHCSPFYLTRVFSRSFGMPPHAYLIQVRVLQAKRRLANGEAIAQVAQEIGFTHQSHLHRHFKRIVGVTPRQYQLMMLSCVPNFVG